LAEIDDDPRSAKEEFLVAVAGPAVSVLLALIAGTLSWAGYAAEWAPSVVLILGYLAFINVLVLGFNLVPAFPLDGGRILCSILWAVTGNLRRATYWASLAGRGFAWLLILWGIFLFLAGNWLNGIWIALIGLFLRSAAQTGYQQVLVKQVLQRVPVGRFMNHEPIVVPPTLNLRSWVDDYVHRFHRGMFPVVSDGRLEGWIDTPVLSQIPTEEWERYAVEDAMRHELTAVTIPHNADLYEALTKLRRSGSSRLFVIDGDRLVGVISLTDLVSFLSLRIELEGEEGPPPEPDMTEAPGAERMRIPVVSSEDRD
jgi:CBS domain-containing protein